MKLTVLVDNNTLIDRYLLGEPGVSYFIEEGSKILLFDVGFSDVFIRNAQKMNIDLSSLDFVALSHAHLDHTWGLVNLIQLWTEAAFEGNRHKKPAFVAHPSVFLKRSIKDVYEIGSLISEEMLSRFFSIKLSREPMWLTEKLDFLGEIQRNNDFDAKTPVGKVYKSGSWEDDYVTDDSALAYRSEQGLVVITGCSHAGICNIVEKAKEVCQDTRVVDIIGGFHLQDPEKEQLQATLQYMKQLQPLEVHACHCTDLRSKIVLSQIVDLREVGSGLRLEYDV